MSDYNEQDLSKALNNVVRFDSSTGQKNSKKNNSDSASGNDGKLFQGLSSVAPRCPNYLSKEAKAHFRFFVKELGAAGLLATIDQGALEILSTSYARMKEAEILLQEEGTEFQKTPNNYLQLSPYSIAYDRHSSRYEKLCKQFGVTLRARQQIRVENPNQGALDL